MAASYIIGDGDCMASIAFEHGFFWATLWEMPANAALRVERKSPFLFVADDRVEIPDKRERVETGAARRFRRKGVPEYVRLRFLDRRGEPFPVTGEEYAGVRGRAGSDRDRQRTDEYGL
jgi:hypothetical protein